MVEHVYVLHLSWGSSWCNKSVRKSNELTGELPAGGSAEGGAFAGRGQPKGDISTDYVSIILIKCHMLFTKCRTRMLFITTFLV